MNMQMDRRVTEEWEKSLRETVAKRHLFLWEMALFVWQVETSDMREIKIFLKDLRVMRNILILEPDDEKVPQLVFLLNLSDIRCTVARTIEEALNWLNADQLMMTGFDLFLLNSLQSVELKKTLLAEISRSITVPVVYVQRENLPLPEPLDGGIVTCHPDNLLSCLHECLVPENKRPGEDSSGHQSAD